MPKPLREATGVVEKATTSATGAVRRNIQIITPGWGSSGYYSADVLERAATNRVIPAGTHMYLNHASESERKDRPERDVEKIAAVLVEDAIWDGARLHAPADLIGPHAELIESLAPYIGVSISGSATDITIGEAEGRTGPIIEDLAAVSSVDFVTRAGRGGAVLLESARPSLVNARAIAHGVAEATANDTREELQQQLRDRFGDDKSWVWVRDFEQTDDGNTVWYEHETPDSAGTYQLAYTVDDSGVVALSADEPVEVQQKTTFVPATRSDSTTTTTEADQEVTMGNIQIEESVHTALTEKAGRVDALEAERDTEKARADAAEQKLAEATAAAAAKDRPRSPRDLMEARDREKDQRIAILEAKDDARNVVNEELSSAWLPPSTVARLSTELMSDLPMVEGKLDTQGLRNRCVEKRDAAELEAAEALEAAGVGTPRGLAAQRVDVVGDVTRYAEQISESLNDAFDLSEAEAQTAAKGR